MSGGNMVTITGSGFDAGTNVTFGGVAATLATEPSSTTLNVFAPAAPAAGPVTLRVTNSAGEELVLEGGYVYVAPVTVSSVSPSTIDLSGGWVSIAGTGFTRGIVVTFDHALVPVRTVTPIHVEAQVPAGVPGYVELELAQPGTPTLSVPNAVRRADLTPPVVVRWEPMDSIGFQNVPLSPTLVIQFNEQIDPTSISAVRLTCGSDEVLSSPSLGPDGTSIVLIPSAPLTSTTSYKLSASGVKDPSGNVLAWAEKSFRTVDTIAPTISLEVAGAAVAEGHRLAAASTGISSSSPAMTIRPLSRHR
jgi:hypothetical protein